jgi:hypothetical protein
MIMEKRFDLHGGNSHGGYAAVYKREELAVQVFPRLAITGFSGGDFAATPAQTTLNDVIVKSFVKKSGVHGSHR